ncbi:hypothetical protein, partial [Mesorhizobium sp. M1A.F.Ca.IN.020.03.1.1]|uniref:hypothetical protein n=1 Tax=Mesorhizobium sp. M1A.F.Ca.IN.020.03.1.1 TaxID=2496764 RepID=UPI0019D08396
FSCVRSGVPLANVGQDGHDELACILLPAGQMLSDRKFSTFSTEGDTNLIAQASAPSTTIEINVISPSTHRRRGHAQYPNA